MEIQGMNTFLLAATLWTELFSSLSPTPLGARGHSSFVASIATAVLAAAQPLMLSHACLMPKALKHPVTPLLKLTHVDHLY